MDASVIKPKAKAKLIFSIKTDTLTNEGKVGNILSVLSYGRKNIIATV